MRLGSMGVRTLAVIALAAAAACTTRVTTSIRHPMQAGQLDPNRIPLTYGNVERRRGLPPGSLDDEAEITRLDTETMCFDVTMRAITEGNGQTWTDLRNYEVALDAGEDLRVIAPELQLRENVAQQFNGLNPVRRRTGTRRVCANYSRTRNGQRRCTRWRSEPVYQTVYVPGIVTVIAGGGQFCFANQGIVTPETDRVKLVLRRSGGRSLEWEWLFESIVAEGG